MLGAAAGGGFPQWNCNCDNCTAARHGEPGVRRLTQSSLAVSADGEAWALINASPDLGTQIATTPALHPRNSGRAGLRDSPIVAVLLTNGDIDHVAGLLSLREKQGFDIVATGGILDVLAANPIFAALDAELVARRKVRLDEPFALAPGLQATLFAVPGKVPLYLEGETVVTDLEGEQTVGVEIEGHDGARLFHIPGCARVTPALGERLRGAELVFFDGTLWRDDEMIRAGVGTKTGLRMGHISMDGEAGSIAALAPLELGRKIFIHINNTNPVLREGSAERREAERAGWEIAYDGMEVRL